jgi:hypothetical protein
VLAIFTLGLFPAEPLGKTELAARHFHELVTAAPASAPVALGPSP